LAQQDFTGPEKKPFLSEKQKKFFSKNIIYLAAGGVLCIALIIFIVLNTAPDEPADIAAAGKDGQTGENFTYLPDLTRTIDGQKPAAEPAAQQPRDPFAGGMALKGIITGGSGGDLAVIEAGNTAYILGVDATVAGEWTVKEINKDSVIMTSQEQELRLEFNGKARHTSIEPPPQAASSAQEGEVTGND